MAATKQVSPERSKTMRAVKRRDTTPELRVAQLLDEQRIAYRRDAADLPGRPDFVFDQAGVALFVHGCWWHGHHCPRGDRVPKTNRAYWLAKITRNRRRDRRVTRQLRERGWSVWAVWECRLKSGGLPTRLLNRLIS